VIAESYRKQVELLLHVLPYVAEVECFALKGGTAINLQRQVLKNQLTLRVEQGE
jgi:hypothetical protein